MTLRHSPRLTCAVAAAWLALAASIAGETRPSQRDADSLSRKLLVMRQHADAPVAGQRLTPITEDEVNAFLRLTLSDRLPVGVRDPQVTLVGDGKLSARAIVDLDAVRRAARNGGEWLDPRQFLAGQLPVSVRGLLRAENGTARFELDGADVNGIPLPRMLLQEIVTYYSRSAEFPSGVALDAPFELPARIREIHVDAHQAVVVQH
jgi:hypothetical protein